MRLSAEGSSLALVRIKRVQRWDPFVQPIELEAKKYRTCLSTLNGAKMQTHGISREAEVTEGQREAKEG